MVRRTKKTNQPTRQSQNGDSLPDSLEREPDEVKKPNDRSKSQVVKGDWTQYEMATALLKRIGPIKCVDKVWYKYNLGVWKEVSKRTFDQAALDIIQVERRSDQLAEHLLKMVNMMTQVDQSVFRKVVSWEDGRQKSILINVADAVVRIDLESGKHQGLPHHPDYLFLNQLPVRYVPGARCDLFKKTLREVLPDQKDHLLFRYWFSHCFLPDSRLESCLICVGEAASGKSTLVLYGVGSIFGLNSSCKTSISLQQLCRESDELRHLKDSLLNIGTEINYRVLEDSSNFKLLVSGEQIMICPKYISSYELTVTTKFCFLSNQLPQFKRGSEAESRRIRIIHFPHSIDPEDRDPTLKEKLQEEKEGIFQWLLEVLPTVVGLKEMIRGGELSEKTFEIFKVNNNPMRSFVDKYVVEGAADLFVIKNDFMRAFRNYVKDESMVVNNNTNSLWSTFYSLKPQYKSQDRKMVDGKREHVIYKMTLTDEAIDRFLPKREDLARPTPT